MGTNEPTQLLFFDKVSFTLPIKSYKRMELLNKINEVSSKKHYKLLVYGDRKGRYKNNYKVTIHKDITVELSLYPINKRHNFFRIEYNPTKLGKEGRAKLLKFLLALLGIKTVKEIFFKAFLTRLDLTLDVYDMEPHLYIYKKRSEHSKIIRRADNLNIIESQIIGSGKSNIRITMYNKITQQGIDDNSINYQRVEVRYRNVKYRGVKSTMATISNDLLNGIGDINFYRDGFLDDINFSTEFRTHAYQSGLNYAFNFLNDNDRRRYRRYLERYKSSPITMHDLSLVSAQRKAFRGLLHKKEYYNRLESASNNMTYQRDKDHFSNLKAIGLPIDHQSI